MNIHITLVMHTLVDEPVELVQALAGPDTTFHIYVHSRIPEVMAAAESLREVANARVEQVGYNAGLARSWNQGFATSILDSADVIMLANDDTEANRHDMLRIAEAAMDCRATHYMINGEGWHIQTNEHAGLQLALAAFTPLSFETIGLFDEGFLFIYHEDVDLFFRANLAGLKPYSIGETNIRHLGGQTIRRNDQVRRQLEIAVPRNEQYYLRKWGGPNGREVFERPFNNSEFGLKINFEDRHCPYPGFQRTDLEELLAIE